MLITRHLILHHSKTIELSDLELSSRKKQGRTQFRRKPQVNDTVDRLGRIYHLRSIALPVSPAVLNKHSASSRS